MAEANLSGYPHGRFATTRWSMVLSAGNARSARGRESLAELCEMYWRPVYAYVRKRGEPPDDARDLTQEFFAALLEKNYVAAADPSRGKFRSFLLASVQHFLLNAWDRKRARKRGGGIRHESLDIDPEEHFIRDEPSTPVTPEKIFEHQWALALVERVVGALRVEQARSNRTDHFELLLPLMCAERHEQSYEQIAAAMGSTAGAVRVAVHRLRRRFRALLLAEIASTVSAPEQVEEELDYLLTVLQPPEGRA